MTKDRMATRVIAYVDKTVVRITGVRVKGLKPCELERALSDRVGATVRVIGVSGDAIDMDVYGLDPDALLKDDRGMVRAISATDGIRAADLVRIEAAPSVVEVDAERLPKPGSAHGCGRQKWVKLSEESRRDPDRG